MRLFVAGFLLLLPTQFLLAQRAQSPVEDRTIAGIVLNEDGEPAAWVLFGDLDSFILASWRPQLGNAFPAMRTF